MSESHWDGSGGSYTLSWGGRPWTLNVDEPEPGLRVEGRQPGLPVSCACTVSPRPGGSKPRCSLQPHWSVSSVIVPASRRRLLRRLGRVDRAGRVESVVRGGGRRSGSPGFRDVGRPAPRRRSDGSKPVGAALAHRSHRRSGPLGRAARCAFRGPQLRWPRSRRRFAQPDNASHQRGVANRASSRRRGLRAGVYYVEMVQPNDAARQIRMEPSQPELPLL